MSKAMLDRRTLLTSTIAASAAAQLTGFPEYVPPRPPVWALSITSARPVTALNGKPPAKDFAVISMSGSSW